MKEILMYGVVGEAVTDSSFIAELNDAKSEREVTVRISSPGGNAFQGVAILNAMKRFPGTVHVAIDGWAASAGSIIAMGASPGRITIASNGMYMVHSASLDGWQTASEMEKSATVLRKLDNSIAQAYSVRTGKPITYWLSRMSVETYYSAREALDEGLADQIGDASMQGERYAAAALMRCVANPAKAEKFLRRLPTAKDVAAKLKAYADVIAAMEANEQREQHRQVLQLQLRHATNPYQRRALQVTLENL